MRKPRIVVTVTAGVMLLLMSAEARSERESWYLSASLGAATDVNHPEWAESMMSSLDKIGGTTRSKMTYRFGLYFPIPRTNLLIGGTWCGMDDQVGTDYERITLTQAQTSVSLMYSFGEEPGTGLFLRADQGTVKADISYDCDWYVDCVGTGKLAKSPEGTGRILAVGYGLPISKGTRLLLDYSMASRTISDETYEVNSINVSILW